jgi:hypothetical protein
MEFEQTRDPGPTATPSHLALARQPGPRAARAVRTAGGVDAAADFIGRLAGLTLAEVRRFIGEWHHAVATDADRWFAAEAAVAEAVSRSRRHAEQRVLLRLIADTVTNALWYRHAQTAPGLERRVRATEASGQYAATLAMLALLVRDHLDEGDFAAVYAPFTELIPLEDVAPEPGVP